MLEMVCFGGRLSFVYSLSILEGGFNRYMIKGIPPCLCSATGAVVSGKDAEVCGFLFLMNEVRNFVECSTNLLVIFQNIRVVAGNRK